MKQLLLRIIFFIFGLAQVSSLQNKQFKIQYNQIQPYIRKGLRIPYKSQLFLRATSSIVTNTIKSSNAANPLLISQNIPKVISNLIINSSPVVKLAAITPNIVKTFLKCLYPGELILFILFELNYSKVLKFAHKTQGLLWETLAKGTPLEWNNSILGFVETRCSSLSKLIGCNYIAKIICMILARLGLDIRADFPDLLSRISYTLFLSQSADRFKTQFLRTFFPKIGESRRSSYMVNKSSSVVIWTFGCLIVCEMLSSFLKIPLSSTLAFGGVGGLAIGLSLRDIAANFIGGMLLLVNEPFTPGDMVTFTSGKIELVGRVERVGWGQTRIRGRDTRPTYVPNAHFVQTSVTNMERITHRKFEATVPIRFVDYAVMNDVITRMKERLRTISKLDVLSMPFRVSFVKVGTYCLEIEIVCYFATKSIDEFLTLQQIANMEVIAAIHDCGAQLALPTTLMQVDQNAFSNGIISTNSNNRELQMTSDDNDSKVLDDVPDAVQASKTIVSSDEYNQPLTSLISTTASNAVAELQQTDLTAKATIIKEIIDTDKSESNPILTNRETSNQIPTYSDTSNSIPTYSETLSSTYSFGVKTFGENSMLSDSSVVDGTVQRITAAAVGTASAFPDLGGLTDSMSGSQIDLKGFEYKWVKPSSDDVVVVVNQRNSTFSGNSSHRIDSSDDIWHASIRSAGILTDGRKYFDGVKSAVDLINESSAYNTTPEPIPINPITKDVDLSNVVHSTANSTLPSVVVAMESLPPVISPLPLTVVIPDEPSAFWENDKILHPPQSKTETTLSSNNLVVNTLPPPITFNTSSSSDNENR